MSEIIPCIESMSEIIPWQMLLQSFEHDLHLMRISLDHDDKYYEVEENQSQAFFHIRLMNQLHVQYHALANKIISQNLTQ